MNLIDRLKDDLEWAQANEWEAPIMLADDIEAAIKALEWYSKHHGFLFVRGIGYEEEDDTSPCAGCIVASGEVDSNGKWTDCRDVCHEYARWVKSKGE